MTRNIADLLFFGAAAIFVTLGVAHGALTLQDLVRPRSFTPTDDAVRAAMERARMRIAPQVSIWRAWLGFNLSHSLGLILFGGLLLVLTIDDVQFFEQRAAVRLIPAAVAALYALLGLRFWFWIPATGAIVATVALLAAVML
jgi:hypothetical protein